MFGPGFCKKANINFVRSNQVKMAGNTKQKHIGGLSSKTFYFQQSYQTFIITICNKDVEDEQLSIEMGIST